MAFWIKNTTSLPPILQISQFTSSTYLALFPSLPSSLFQTRHYTDPKHFHAERCPAAPVAPWGAFSRYFARQHCIVVYKMDCIHFVLQW